MEEKIILLVEDNPNDVKLTLRAFKKNNIKNKIIVAKDGVEALDYLFGTGVHARRDLNVMPKVILLDLKLPKVNGIEVLKRVRENPWTNLLPVIILTSSNEDKDVIESYLNHANSYIRKAVDFEQFSYDMQQLGIYWLVINEPPPKQDK